MFVTAVAIVSLGTPATASPGAQSSLASVTAYTYDVKVHLAAGHDAREALRAPPLDAAAEAPIAPVSRSATGVAAKAGGAANQLAGNAARDVLAAAHPGSLIEQSLSTTAGVRRLDVLTRGGLGIESKVGRTSLTAATRSQVAKDSLLLGNGDVTGMEWVFSRSGVTGQMGPTGPLADALGKAGIPWSLAP